MEPDAGFRPWQAVFPLNEELIEQVFFNPSVSR
jgi:hypothetical protein